MTRPALSPQLSKAFYELKKKDMMLGGVLLTLVYFQLQRHSFSLSSHCSTSQDKEILFDFIAAILDTHAKQPLDYLSCLIGHKRIKYGTYSIHKLTQNLKQQYIKRTTIICHYVALAISGTDTFTPQPKSLYVQAFDQY